MVYWFSTASFPARHLCRDFSLLSAGVPQVRCWVAERISTPSFPMRPRHATSFPSATCATLIVIESVPNRKEGTGGWQQLWLSKSIKMPTPPSLCSKQPLQTLQLPDYCASPSPPSRALDVSLQDAQFKASKQQLKARVSRHGVSSLVSCLSSSKEHGQRLWASQASPPHATRFVELPQRLPGSSTTPFS